MNGQGNESALTSSRWRWGVPVLLAIAALLAGAALRSCNLRESLWVDELHTSWTVNGSWTELVHRAAWGNQPPIYYGITKILTSLGGDSETMLRLPSWLAGCAIIALGTYLVYVITGQSLCAAVAAWLLALDIELIFYAQEARPYAFVQFLILIHVLIFVGRLPIRRQSANDDAGSSANAKREPIGKRGWPSRVGWMVTLWLAFYCHYTALIILSWEFCVTLGLALLTRQGRREWRELAIDTGLICIGLLPAAWHVWAIAQRQGDWSVLVQLWPLPRQIAEAIVMYGFPSLLIAFVAWLGQRQGRSERKTSVDVAACENAAPSDKAAIFGTAKYCRTSKHFVTLWGASLVLVIASLWMASRWLGVAWFLPRYFIGLWPLIVVFPALVVAYLPPGFVRVLGIGLLFFIVVIENPMLNAPAAERYRAIQRGENWRAAIAALAESEPSIHTLFLFPNLVEDKRLDTAASDDFVAYLEFPVRASYRLPTEDRRRDWDVRDRDVRDWKVIVRSLQADPLLRQSDLERMTEERQFRILLRGQPQDVEWVLQEMAAGLAPQDLTFDALVERFGSVFLVDVTVLTPKALEAREANRQPD